ncbi:MAG: type II toxin-antitoxin system RelE/ParE family toxin [Planctomycetes bacterium]|nr:type II toxin-antitoxin system RelE/ParE family toxin [Planctomycetota bacterium]
MEYTDLARREIHSYVAYISEENPEAAKKWAKQVKAKIEGLQVFPRMGHVVREIDDNEVVETVVHSHRIIYRIAEDRIEVLRVWHGARNLTLEDIQGEQDE